MDEDYLSWLLVIPGIGRRRAELLAAKFPSIEALRAATSDDIAVLEGIGPRLAKRVKDFVESAAPGVDRLYRDGAGLYLCPECGALIARDAKQCPFCGTTFEGEEAGEAGPEPEVPTAAPKPADILERSGQALNLCPNCGVFVGTDAKECPSCGITLEGEEAAEAEVLELGADAGDRLQREGQGLFLCPSCGALVGAGAAACPKCGTTLEGEEAAPPAEAEAVAELPPEAITGESSLFVCTNCGAFLRAGDRKCPSCGVEFEGEVEEQVLAAREEEGGVFPICPN